MPSLIDEPAGKTYWRSLEHRANTPEFRALVEREFPGIVDQLNFHTSRRNFLKVMGASLALAGATGCRWPKEAIIPLARRPENRIPGEPVYYATTLERDGVGLGAVVTSYEGRPIKIEGSPEHPYSLGASDGMMQAEILTMYDPDRSRLPLHKGAVADWEAFRTALATSAGRVAILTAPTCVEGLGGADAIKSADVYFWAPLALPGQSALRGASGSDVRPIYDFRKAQVVAAFDSDFLGAHPAAIRHARDFAANRGPEHMSRLYAVEGNYSLTGANADHRYAERSSAVATRLAQLAAALADKGVSVPAGVAAAGEAPAYIGKMADDLRHAGAHALIVVGPAQPPAAHALAAALNKALGAEGETVSYIESPLAKAKSISELAKRLDAGEVDTLLIIGANPAYDAPADLKFAERIKKAKHSFHVGLYADETAFACEWHAPLAHALETWGLSRAWDGRLCVSQPLIDPLFNGLTTAEAVAIAGGAKDASAYEITRSTLGAAAGFGEGDGFETKWRKAVHDGLVGDATPRTAPALDSANWATLLDGRKDANAGGFEINFIADSKIYDGRYANNGWLQELPDPLTKLTWDNAALVSPADARELKVSRDDLITIEHAGAKITAPVYVMPGQARGTISIALGYGRTRTGPVGAGVGVNVYPLRTSTSLGFGVGASVARASGMHELVTTQDHKAIDTAVGRAESAHRVEELLQETTIAALNGEGHGDGHGGHHGPHVALQLFAEHEYNGHAWGMSIDLSKCNGCSACVVACQAENNIPVVGKGEVQRGREMQWLRIDRYFKGEPEDADVGVRFQPLPCMQCENAPCEQVCPVAATVHDAEGLNVMVYNRCVGTRYCLNNCPYKVRRFNWFYNHHGPRHPRNNGVGPTYAQQIQLTDLEKMAHNPGVTVRSRGVMEKCTYCVQRINHAKIKAKNASVQNGTEYRIPDGEIVTACAQACPAEAIVFGDLNDHDSRVYKQVQDKKRTYSLLDELLNTKPRTRYLKKLTNPNEASGGHTPAPHA